MWIELHGHRMTIQLLKMGVQVPFGLNLSG